MLDTITTTSIPKLPRYVNLTGRPTSHRAEFAMWPASEDTGYAFVTEYCRDNGRRFNHWVRDWMKIQGVTDEEMHAALHPGDPLSPPTATVLLLADKGRKPPAKTEQQVRTILKVIGVDVWWTMVYLQIAIAPNDARLPEPPHVHFRGWVRHMQLELNEAQVFGAFVRRWLLPTQKRLELCVRKPAMARALKGKGVRDNLRRLHAVLRGRDGKARVHMTLPILEGLSAGANKSIRAVLNEYDAWRNAGTA